ncbi:MAG: fibrobacter succinogenes major paralogous domain-containing protein [Bacteroidales bacterium]|nr:fibrobacter succinogenes major paralogous domain-containing protein [Bacteroidales bacterium]
MIRISLTVLVVFFLGARLHAQELLVHKSDGSIINIAINSIDSITFNIDGSAGQGLPCPGTPTISDVDGNIYNTVLIGNQCWMKENLSTTKYKNGISIEYPGNNNSAWQINTTGAYAWYNNDITSKEIYGALYNWHAVNSNNGLCPEGWHVPDQGDWEDLVIYFVESNGFPNHDEPDGAGNALKSCLQENSPLGGDCNVFEHPRWNFHVINHGFDEYGFSFLPGGIRDVSGVYLTAGEFGYLWSTTEHDDFNAMMLLMASYSGKVSTLQYFKGSGHSIRCLKD